MTFQSKPQAQPVTFTRDSLREFQATYDKALAAGKESFAFQGHEYVARYAYYLLQYVGSRLGVKGKK